jgi:DNA primase
LLQASAKSSVQPVGKGFISDEVIAEIRERTDIIQLVGDYVRLLPSGKNFKGLCPIHKEKTPSFYVLPDKQIYHCFGCQKGGDVFAFLREVEKFTFPEAVHQLARKCGVHIEQQKDPELEKKKGFFSLLDEVAHLYSGELAHATRGREIRDYLKQRGLTPEAAQRFRLGVAPPFSGFLTNHFSNKAEKFLLLQKLGLIKKSTTGSGFYDVFRHRLMIPIFDSYGHVVGFGGRVLLSTDNPKYLNSTDSEVFAKGKMLFNFRNAVSEIRKQNRVIVVEGYLDVISLAQAGIDNVVATLGTAITSDQIHLLARNTENVYFCYDADEAGQKATLRAISLQRETPLTARVITFEDPKDDPDSFVQREGKDAFVARLEHSKDIYTFLIESKTRGIKRPFDISTKEKLIHELKGYVPSIVNPTAKGEFIRGISKLLDMPTEALEHALFSYQLRSIGNAVAAGARDSRDSLKLAQEWIIKHILDDPRNMDKVRNVLSAQAFSDPPLRKIYEAICLKHSAKGCDLKSADILSSLEEPETSARLSELLVNLENQPGQPFQDCLRGVMQQTKRLELDSLSQQIHTAEQQGNYEEVNRLMALQTRLKREVEVLRKNSL